VRDRDNQPQIGIDHLLARFGIAPFDFRRELDLLLRRQTGKPSDLSQVSVQSSVGLAHGRTYSPERTGRYDARVGF
jgi:hypothetical protein